jgi:hypothetical protein
LLSEGFGHHFNVDPSIARHPPIPNADARTKIPIPFVTFASFCSISLCYLL